MDIAVGGYVRVLRDDSLKQEYIGRVLHVHSEAGSVQQPESEIDSVTQAPIGLEERWLLEVGGGRVLIYPARYLKAVSDWQYELDLGLVTDSGTPEELAAQDADPTGAISIEAEEEHGRDGDGPRPVSLYDAVGES